MEEIVGGMKPTDQRFSCSGATNFSVASNTVNEGSLSMGYRFTTLLDTLSSLQFRTVVLLSLGLDTWHIADLLATSEQTVWTCLFDSLRRSGCRDVHELRARVLHECDNDLYDETMLKREMAPLQYAAQKILARSGADLRASLLN